MDAVKIEIHTGRTVGGTWFAISHDIPWLATEGENYMETVNLITKIAPRLAVLANIHAPLKLVWKIEKQGCLQ